MAREVLCLIDVIRIYSGLERGELSVTPERSVTARLRAGAPDERACPAALAAG